MIYRTIAFQGTSLTSGVNAGAWQNVVMNTLQAGCRFELRNYDVGHPGWTSVNGVADVGRWAGLRPDIAVIEFAMNDAVTGSGISVANLKTNLATIVAAVQAQNAACHVFLMTMNPAVTPGSANVPTLASYYQGVRDEASALSVGLIDNTPLWGSPPTGDFLADGIHPLPAFVISIAVPNIVSSLAPFVV